MSLKLSIHIYRIFGIIPSSREYVLKKLISQTLMVFNSISSPICASLSLMMSEPRAIRDVGKTFDHLEPPANGQVGRIFIRQKAFSLTAVNSFVSYDSGLEVICWMCCCFYKRDDIDHLKISFQANNCQICCYLFAISLCGTF